MGRRHGRDAHALAGESHGAGVAVRWFEGRPHEAARGDARARDDEQTVVGGKSGPVGERAHQQLGVGSRVRTAPTVAVGGERGAKLGREALVGLPLRAAGEGRGEGPAAHSDRKEGKDEEVGDQLDADARHQPLRRVVGRAGPTGNADPVRSCHADIRPRPMRPIRAVANRRMLFCSSVAAEAAGTTAVSGRYDRNEWRSSPVRGEPAQKRLVSLVRAIRSGRDRLLQPSGWGQMRSCAVFARCSPRSGRPCATRTSGAWSSPGARPSRRSGRISSPSGSSRTRRAARPPSGSRASFGSCRRRSSRRSPPRSATGSGASASCW